MSCRRAREVVLQSLFQLELNGADELESKQEYERRAMEAAAAEGDELTEADYAFAEGLLAAVREKREELDGDISQVARGWKIARMAVIDRNILRLAAYELKYSKDLTLGIVVNEAVELAKKYGTDDSARFVNGVLGALAKK